MSKLTDLIRKQFPGDYDDLSDSDLEKMWHAKYPKDIEFNGPTPPPEKQPSDVSLSLSSKPTTPKETPEPNLWQKANTPLFTAENALSPAMRAALEIQPQPSVTESFSDKAARYLENATRYGVGKMLGFGQTMSSPLALGLGITTLGSSAAETAGMPYLAKTLEAPSRIAGAGMMGHGLYNIGQGNIAGGIAETGLGALGVKSNLGDVGATLERAGATIPEIGAPLEPVGVPTLASSKFQQALEGSNFGKTKAEWDASLAQQRAQRFGEMEKVSTPGLAGHQERAAILAGGYSKPGFEGILMDQNDVNQLINEIQGNTGLDTPEKFRAETAIVKALQGELLQNNEINLLSKVWGPEFGRSLSNKFSVGGRPVSWLAQGVDATKSLVTAGHFSAPLRNALMLAHRGEFWSSMNEMLQSFVNEGNAARINSAIKSLPDYELMQRTRLAITDLTPTNVEDALRSRITEKIPVYGKYWIKPGNRAYMTYLNTVRASTFQNLVDSYAAIAERLPDPQLRLEANPRTNMVFAQELSDYVNNATGRGSLGKFESSANALNMFFMSPRMQAARVQMVKQLFAGSTPPQVRKEVIKSIAMLLSAGTALGGLAMMSGFGDVSANPTSADFGKIKVHDSETRLDPWEGNQQYIVALAKQIMGGSTSTRGSGERFRRFGYPGSQTRLESAEDFVMNHAAPPWKVAYDWGKSKMSHGQSTFDMNKEAAGMVMPIVAQQLMELSQENPQLLPLAIPGSLGMGVQTYTSR